MNQNDNNNNSNNMKFIKSPVSCHAQPMDCTWWTCYMPNILGKKDVYSTQFLCQAISYNQELYIKGDAWLPLKTGASPLPLFSRKHSKLKHCTFPHSWSISIVPFWRHRKLGT